MRGLSSEDVSKNNSAPSSQKIKFSGDSQTFRIQILGGFLVRSSAARIGRTFSMIDWNWIKQDWFRTGLCRVVCVIEWGRGDYSHIPESEYLQNIRQSLAKTLFKLQVENFSF